MPGRAAIAPFALIGPAALGSAASAVPQPAVVGPAHINDPRALDRWGVRTGWGSASDTLVAQPATRGIIPGRRRAYPAPVGPGAVAREVRLAVPGPARRRVSQPSLRGRPCMRVVIVGGPGAGKSTRRILQVRYRSRPLSIEGSFT